MAYTIDDIEKITEFKSWSKKRKVDALLEIDADLYCNLGKESTKTEIENIKIQSRKIYRLIKKVPGLEDNDSPPQTSDGTETNDPGLDDNIRNERVNDPAKDPDNKAAIMTAAKASVKRKSYPKTKKGDEDYEAEVLRIYNESLNKAKKK